MINIQDIIPFMKDGWVACDRAGHWTWFADKPEMYRDYWWETETYFIDVYLCFDIAPADDWTKSLICIKELNNDLGRIKRKSKRNGLGI